MPIINDPNFDPNKALPMTSPWAWDYYIKGIANNWVPEEVGMESDIKQWKSRDFLSPQERKLVLLNLGFFATAESLTANNLVAISKHITDFQCLQYITRQLWEEAIHTHTFIYCCNSFLSSEEVDKIYKMYKTIPSVKEKDDFVTELTKSISDPNFTTKGKTPEEEEQNIRDFLCNLIGYYLIMEGIFFYAGFAMMLNLGRNGKMVGVGTQFDLILKDEGLHVGFGCDLINAIKKENQQVWTSKFEEEIIGNIKKAVELEKKYAREACPERILGINSQQYCQYIEYIANRRLGQIGLRKVYFKDKERENEITELEKSLTNLNQVLSNQKIENRTTGQDLQVTKFEIEERLIELKKKQSKQEVDNPFLWMSTSTDLNKEKNFFEKRVTEYQTGGRLKWDQGEDEKKS